MRSLTCSIACVTGACLPAGPKSSATSQRGSLRRGDWSFRPSKQPGRAWNWPHYLAAANRPACCQRRDTQMTRRMHRQSYDENRPLRYMGRRRDTCLSYTVECICEDRCFRHLTPKAVRSYLLHLPTMYWGHLVVRSGCPTKTPFYGRFTYRVEAVATCPTCGCARGRDEFRRKVLVAPDAATKVGRDAYADALAFDVGNAKARVAWRLGISCVFCGVFCGTRLPQNQRWPERGPFDRLCTRCARNEKVDAARWQREHGTKPPEEWLLLKAIERARAA